MTIVGIIINKKKKKHDVINHNIVRKKKHTKNKIMETEKSWIRVSPLFFFLFLNFYPCKENFARIS